MSKQKTGINSSQAEQKLYAAYQSLASKKRRTVLLRSLLIFLAGITAFIIAEDLFYFSSLTKTVFLISIVALSSLSLWKGFNTITTQSFQEFYRFFSRNSNLPELKDTLDLEKSTSGNRKLIDAAILQNLSKLEPAKLEQVLNSYVRQSDISHQYKRTLLFTGLILITAGVTTFNFNHAFERSVTFWEAYEKPNPYVFEVKPGNVTIEQGSPFQVDVQFSGHQNPEEVSLQVKTSVEENYRTRGMNISGSTYQSIPFDLNNDLEYYIQMDEYKSEVYTADVQLRPRFSELQATVIPPAYTQLDTVQHSYPFSQIQAFEGSEVLLSGLLNKPVQYVEMNRIDSTEKLSVFDDSTFTHQILITQRDTLTFSMADESGLTNKNSFQLTLSPQKDEYPFVEIIEPQSSFEKVNPKNIHLLFRASDDFQLTGASLHYEHRRAYVDEPATGSTSLEKPDNGVLQSHSWNLEDLNLKPQDVLSFWVEVQDNDGYRSYKTSRSKVLTLTVPSMVDYFEDLDERENEIGTDLEDVSDSFEQMQDQYDEFKERLKENPEDAGYEQKRELEQVQKQQQDVQEKIDELNKKFDEIKKELSENSILSEETQKAYEELKKLMEEIDDPAYLEALERLKEQLGQMNPEQLRESMEELEFNEELYKERLERTIELFKQLKLNSDLDKLAKAFEDQARKEEELSEGDASEETKKQQKEQSLKENQQLKEKVDALSENTSKKNEKKISEFQKETAEELEQIREQLEDKPEEESQDKDEQKGQNEESGENEQQDGNNQSQSPQQSYKQLAEKTKSMMKGMNQQQMQVNIAGMQYALHSLLTLSVEQENLSHLAAATENRSQAYVTFARDQRNVEDIFAAISDSLFQLSAEIPQLSNEINKKKMEVEKQLNRALEQMAERNQSKSSVASRQALGGINDISFMIANLLEQLQNSQNGGGGGGMSSQQMMEQLQQSGEQQQQLNQQLQDMINDIQGERLSQDQMERLDQMAKEQNRIRKQLQQIQQGGEGGDKIGSELERMIEDMEDTINDLRGGAADPLMIERQQNILSRMLEAENAMQERDEEDKREGNIAEEFDRATPPELTLEELEKQIRNRLNDPDFTKYSTDYQRLIEKYFELLKQLQNRES